MAIKKRRKNILIYNDKIMIISIGIGTQGALPGSALYAGATCEGIGRFIFNGFNGVDSPENITKKADLANQSALLALASRYTNGPYPLEKLIFLLAQVFFFQKRKSVKKQKRG